MKYIESDSELFDLYLSDKLSHKEKTAFEKRLDTDQEFAASYRMHALLAEGIKAHARDDLKTYLKENAKMQYWGENFWPRSMRFAAAAAIIIFSGLYVVIKFYVQPEIQDKIAVNKEETIAVPEIGDSVYQPPFAETKPVLEKNDLTLKDEKMEADRSFEPAAAEKEIIANDDVREDFVVANGATVNLDQGMTDNYKVLEDIKKRDTLITPVYLAMIIPENKSSGKYYKYNSAPQNDNDTKDANQKLPSVVSNQVQSKAIDKQKANEDSKDTSKIVSNKKAEVSKWSNKSLTLNVEYWESPVHFKGYTLKDNNIRLYGIEQTGTAIFIYNNIIYVRNAGVVYRLDACADACPYVLEKDPEIVKLILEQKP